MDENSQDQGNNIGRPLMFESPEVLQKLISDYFKSCEPKYAKRKVVQFNTVKKTVKKTFEWYVTDPIPYTVSGLAVALGTSRETLLEYQARPAFVDTITRAKAMIERWWEVYLANGKNPNAAIFNLKNNWGWVDRTEIRSNKTDFEVANALEERERQREQSAIDAQRELEEEHARSQV